MDIGSLTGSSALMILFGRWSVVIRLLRVLGLLRLLWSSSFAKCLVDSVDDGLVVGILGGLIGDRITSFNSCVTMLGAIFCHFIVVSHSIIN